MSDASWFDGVTWPRLRILVSLPGSATTDPQSGYLVLDQGPALDTGILSGPVWTDFGSEIGKNIRRISIKLGQTSEIDQITPATASFVVNNSSGDYDPLNPASPYNIANLLPRQDSDFNSGYGSWRMQGGFSAITTVATTVAEGAGALRLTADGGASPRVATDWSYPVSSGQAVTVGVLARTSVAHNCRVGIQWLNPNGSVNSTTNGTAISAGTSSWTQLEASGTAPVTGYVAMQFQSTDTPTSGDLFYLDQAQVSLTASLPTWVPGGTVGLDLGRPVWVLADYQNVSDPLFYGVITAIIPDYGLDPIVEFQCVDRLESLGRVGVGAITSSYAGDLTGTRIGRILDAAGHPSNQRSLDAGSQTCQATTLGDNALPLLQAVVDTELGQLYQDGDGNVVFYDRTRLYTTSRSTTVQATLSDTGSDVNIVEVQLVKDGSLLFNQARITRDGGTEQVATDADSAAAYGTRTWPNQSGTLLQADADALSMATWLVSKYNTPQMRVQQISVNGLGANQWATLLGLRRLDRIRVIRDYGPVTINREELLEGIEIEIDAAGPRWDWVFYTSDADTFTPMILDSGVLDTAKLA